MSHLTSESVNDSVACCVVYGTLLSVSVLSQMVITTGSRSLFIQPVDLYEGWNFNSGNYLFTTDTK